MWGEKDVMERRGVRERERERMKEGGRGGRGGREGVADR